MSFIRDLYFFTRLFVLLLFVLQKLDAACEHNIKTVEEKFYEVSENEFNNPSINKLMHLLTCQNMVIKFIMALLVEGEENIPEMLEDNILLIEESFRNIIPDSNEFPSYFILKAISNQFSIYPYSKESPYEKEENLKKRLERISLFEQFKKLNLEDTNGEDQKLIPKELCSMISEECYNKTVSAEEFEDVSNNWSFSKIILNNKSLKPPSEFYQKFEEYPLFQCSSEQIKFFFTTFKSDENKLLFLLKNEVGNVVKLDAFTSVKPEKI